MSVDILAMVWLVPLIPVLVWAYIKYWDSVFNTWKRRGIPSLPGSFPYGTHKGFTRETVFAGGVLQEMYNKFPKAPYFGFFQGSLPQLVLRDPEMIRAVLAKEFSHFRERQGFKVRPDDVLAHHLFNLEGDKWRALRVKMTPVFTSGKMKAMFPLFVKCTETLSNLLYSKLGNNLDMKEVSARFSTDVICSCAFGLEVNSMNDEENQFRAMGKRFLQLDLNVFAQLKLALKRYLPFFQSNAQPRMTPIEVERFMVKAIKDTIEHREKTGEKRNDFIDLLMQLKGKGILNEDLNGENVVEKSVEPVELTFELMAAQCFVFFVAGFETSSSVQTFCLYELAHNPEIQERLHKEIEATIERNGGISYKALQEMEYLDMVVYETMRKYPTLTMLNRKCTKEFTTPYGHTIEKGDRIIIPLWALHRDPHHFPNPEKFDPERFSKENKDSINPFVYMPFGEGPRICIGSRFGLLQTKMGILTVIRKYIVSPCEQTPNPLVYDSIMPILTRVKGTIALKITKREKS